MYPTLFKFGNFEITTFGLMMFLAFVAAGWVLTRQFRRYGLSDDLASTIVMAAAIGGIVGAKIYYAILYHSWAELFSRAGLVWYGGMIGGSIACSFVLFRHRVDLLAAADAAAPALAIGYALGRIGCFLVGDDYGAPTNGWWGVAFPKGSPPTTAYALREFGVRVNPNIPDEAILKVHPTQIYESLAAFVMFAILMRVASRPHRKGTPCALALILLGIERFLVEIVRAKDDRFLGPFTVAQLISVIIVVIGIVMLARRGSGAPEIAPQS
ncbi:MAG TPA: prolipoprotein diacylglyceryl transferase [Thermoanaerobaculia bacterium]